MRFDITKVPDSENVTSEVAVFVTVQVQPVIFESERTPMVPSVVMLPLRVYPFWRAALLTSE